MSKESGRSQTSNVTARIEEKIKELAELVSLEKYGPEGPPYELTWREIEDVGHEVGQLASRQIDSVLQQQHAEFFLKPQRCPQCNGVCEVHTSVPRDYWTRHGDVNLDEPCLHCDACKRCFFPSAYHLED